MKQFFETYENFETNVIEAYKNGERILFFEGALFDAILYLNNVVKNFRLTGVTILTLFEPTLKEMGLVTLSRVERLIFLKKHPLAAPEVWDKFLVHRVKKVQYAKDVG